MKKERILIPILLLATSVIWGSSFILIKRGLLAFSPEQVGLLRIVFAWIVLFPIALFHFKTYLKRSGALIVCGLTGNLIPAILFAVAQTNLDSGITGVLNALTPLFTLAIGFLFFSAQVKKVQFWGIIIGLLGSVSLSLINKGGQLGSINFFVTFVILASLLYGVNVNFIKRYLSDIPSLKLTALALFFMGPPSLLYLFFTDFLTIVTTHSQAIESLIYIAILGILNTAVALILFFKLLQLTNALVASSVTYIIPVIALLLGFLDGETVGFYHFMGMLIILAGVYMVNYTKENK